MSTLGIIGTAGRRDDRARMTPLLWENMLAYAIAVVERENPDTLISGGAAWADHLAVVLYRQGIVPSLRLHLPASFQNSRFTAPPGQHRHPGSVANYYHDTMSRTLGISSRRELQLAIDQGAEVRVTPGFKQRNSLVAAESDYLLAFTFGTHSGIYIPGTPGYLDHVAAGLKAGGTADTWNKAKSKTKEHKSLWELQNSIV